MTQLIQFNNKTKELVKQATDLCADPIVQHGYQISGQNANTVYMNLQSMALKRAKQFYPLVNPKSPLFQRVIAELKLIVAECIFKKYQCRAQRKPYAHLNDIDKRCKQWFFENEGSLNQEYLALNSEPI